MWLSRVRHCDGIPSTIHVKKAQLNGWHSISSQNPLWSPESPQLLPRMCCQEISRDKYDQHVVYELFREDIRKGLNWLIRASIEEENCTSLSKARMSHYNDGSSMQASVMAHHIGAYTVRYAIEEGIALKYAFELLVGVPGSITFFANGFLHGGMTQAMCFAQQPGRRSYVLQPEQLFALVNISTGGTSNHWFNAMHGFGEQRPGVWRALASK